MAIEVLYQKRNFGTFENNSQRSIFVDEKHLEQIEARVEFKIGSVLQDINEFVLEYNKIKIQFQIGDEIRSAEDFFRAKYLQQPSYNFHEQAIHLRKLIGILLSDFISSVMAVIARIDGTRPKSEQDLNLEMAKIRRLEGIAARLTHGNFKLLPPKMKSWTEFGFANREEFYKSEQYAKLLAQHEKELVAFRKNVMARVEEFGETIANSEQAIRELRKISEDIIKGRGFSKKDAYSVSKRLSILALRNADTDKKTVILKESVLEEEILRLLNEFDESRRLVEQKYSGHAVFRADFSDAVHYELRIEILERISWLRREILNLLELYVEEITQSISTEAVLELEEIQILAKVGAYSKILTELPPLFREILQVNRFIEKLRELAINVGIYSRESLKWEMHSEEELIWLSNELKKLDYLFSAHEDLNRVANPEKLLDVIPREVQIQGVPGITISGDLYLKDTNYRPKVGIIAIHGINDSRRVYYSLAARAANMGFLVYCPDLPSHGHPSEGTLRFGTTSESMLLVIRHLKEKFGLEKIGVIGWSLGSMVALFQLMRYTAAIEESLERLDTSLNKTNFIDSEQESRRAETRALIMSEYAKYKDCGTDAVMLLTPVDHIQTAARLKGLQDLMGRKFPLFVDMLIFFGYRKFLKRRADNMKDADNPPGTRFYFKKNPWVQGVKNPNPDKPDGFYNKMMDRLKLSKEEEPIKARALKIWNSGELKYVLVAPSQMVYFNLLQQVCPEIIEEIRRVPKVAVFAADDTLVRMRKRGMDLIKLFEGFGNMKPIVLKEIGHDLDYNGDGHNLYIDPVLIHHFYDFFLILAEQ